VQFNVFLPQKLKRRILWIPLALFCTLCQFNSYAFAQKIPLSLPEAEQLAINQAPELLRLRANAGALEAQSVADGQLSDPQLIVGAANVPTNSFSFTQDDMTMVNVGLQQSFPRGHSLAMKSKQTRALATAEDRKVQEQAAMLMRNIRETWLDLYYWIQVAHVINENHTLYRRLLKSTESQYVSSKASQSDLLQLKVEVSRLNDQSVQTQQRIDVLRAQLGRWLGEDQANRPLTRMLPMWSNPPNIEVMKQRLQEHPLLKVDLANIEAARDQVAYAKEQYKPGWMLDVGYGIRQGTYMDRSGMKRSNFVGAQVTVDLPFFTGNRQDKSLRASAYQLQASELDREIHYKDLIKELTVQYAMWHSLSQRDSLYHKQLLPEARQNSKAALLAYQNTTTDLTTVLRAYSNNLTIQLEQLQVQVERAKARAALLYLEGVTV
jgi:outer membrane protein TolC